MCSNNAMWFVLKISMQYSLKNSLQYLLKLLISMQYLWNKWDFFLKHDAVSKNALCCVLKLQNACSQVQDAYLASKIVMWYFIEMALYSQFPLLKDLSGNSQPLKLIVSKRNVNWKIKWKFRSDIKIFSKTFI